MGICCSSCFENEVNNDNFQEDIEDKFFRPINHHRKSSSNYQNNKTYQNNKNYQNYKNNKNYQKDNTVNIVSSVEIPFQYTPVVEYLKTHGPPLFTQTFQTGFDTKSKIEDNILITSPFEILRRLEYDGYTVFTIKDEKTDIEVVYRTVPHPLKIIYNKNF